MSTPTESRTGAGTWRYVVAAALVLGAFFGAYRFAAARSSSALPPAPVADAGAVPAATGATPQEGAAAPTDPSATPGCACCGSTAATENGVTGEETRGTARVGGETQAISIDLSNGYYDPNVIVLKAGMPAEITFAQSSGCTAQVVSEDLGFAEDLTAGPRTVSLPALEEGEYAFSCGMQMVFGKIVVE
jgi:hypothetical protein